MKRRISEKEIWIADVRFNDKDGSKLRPVLIAEIKKNNLKIYPLTSHVPREYYSGEYLVKHWERCGLIKPSTIRGSDVKNIRKSSLIKRIGKIHNKDWSNFKTLV